MYPCLMISNGPDVVHPRRGHCLGRIRRLGSVWPLLSSPICPCRSPERERSAVMDGGEA